MIRYIRDVHTSLDGYKLIGKCTLFSLWPEYMPDKKKIFNVLPANLAAPSHCLVATILNHYIDNWWLPQISGCQISEQIQLGLLLCYNIFLIHKS